MFQSDQLDDQVNAFTFTLKQLKMQRDQFANELPQCVELGLLRLDTTHLSNRLKPSPVQILKQFGDFMPAILNKRIQIVKTWLNDSCNNLKNNQPSIEEFVQRTQNLNIIQKKLPNYKLQFSILQNLATIMEEYKFEMKKEDKLALQDTIQIMKKLDQSILAAEEASERNLERYSRDIKYAYIPKLNQEVHKLEELVRKPEYIEGGIDRDRAISELFELTNQYKSLEKTARVYNNWENTLKLELTRFEDLETIKVDLELRYQMWKSDRDWDELQSQWIGSKFTNINVKEIKEKADEYSKVVAKCIKNLPANPTLTKLKEKVDRFKDMMPIVTSLRNPYLQSYHWDEIKRRTNTDINIQDENFTLQTMVNMNLSTYQEEIQDVSNQATQEHELSIKIKGTPFAFTSPAPRPRDLILTCALTTQRRGGSQVAGAAVRGGRLQPPDPAAEGRVRPGQGGRAVHAVRRAPGQHEQHHRIAV